MTNLNRIILSQLSPPAQRSNILRRERVVDALKEALGYPLSILVAGTGYGKTTSLLSLIDGLSMPVFWYSVSSAERDPAIFLNTLFSVFNQHGHKGGQAARRALTNDTPFNEALITLVNSLSEELQEESLLILDDFQCMANSDEILLLMDWLLNHLPPRLHVLIATRTPLDFPSLRRWRMKGDLLELGREALIFSPDEIEDLFLKSYQLPIQKEAVRELSERTEGWAIGLQVVRHSMRKLHAPPLQRLPGGGRNSLDDLFDYMADEVLEQLDEEIKVFLLRSSILNVLEGETCDFLLDRHDSLELLNELFHRELFVDQLKPGIFRYHHMFREFLQNRLSREGNLARELHRKIASYYSAHEYWERAISHLLSAEDYPAVRHTLDMVGEQMLQSGYFQSIRYWLTTLPPAELAEYAYGNYLLGQAARYNNAFDQALEHYRTAQRLYQQHNQSWGLSLALRGQAQVYLDTLRPLYATQLLNRALEVINPQENRQEAAQLLIQIAENQVNLGDVAGAESNLKRADSLAGGNGPEANFTRARLLLRTGALDEGIALLNKLDGEPGPGHSRPPRFHREAPLLLSLFYSLKGESSLAQQYAREGLEVGEALQSALVRKIGQMRLGHALQLNPRLFLDPEAMGATRRLYEDAIKNIDIVRIHVEPLWGLVRLLGYAGQIEEAKTIAEQALGIADSAGDRWIAVLVRISLGASLYMQGDFESASEELSRAEATSTQVEDTLTHTASLLWQALIAQRQGYKNSSMVFLEQALQACSEHKFDFLFTRTCILGANDPNTFLPLLIMAREAGLQNELVKKLLNHHKLGKISYHPACTLHVKTLGAFGAWLGVRPIAPEDWKRGKARQLFQLLVGHAGHEVSKEQLATTLWPDADGLTANNNFKVVLNALNQVLEPERPSGEAPSFVVRQQELYRLNPEMPIDIDFVAFEKLALSPRLEDKLQALELYHGRFFAGEWVQEAFMAEVAYLHRLYLGAAQETIEDRLSRGDLKTAQVLCERVMQIDPDFEAVYLLQMRIYHALGQGGMMRQVYRSGLERLRALYGEGGAVKDLQELYDKLCA